MNLLLKIEELAMFLLAVFLFTDLDYSWWLFLLLLLTPDLSMAGYLFSSRAGAIFYNLLHHRGFAITLYLWGALGGSEYLQLAGTILFAHACLDRMLGFGLKYPDDFKHTHLGWIGNHAKRT